MSRSRPSRSGATVVLLVLVPALIVAACIPPEGRTRPPAGRQMVYFVPQQPAHPERQPLPPAEWPRKGVTVVHGFAGLRTAVGLETEAILVDAEALPQVPTEWLRAQYERGRVIIGININLNELYPVVGEPMDVPSRWNDWPPDVPHFALMARGPRCARKTQNAFYEVPLNSLLGLVREAVGCAKE